MAWATAEELEVDLVVVHESVPGKAQVLNRALELVDTPYVVTIDADTLLHPHALRRLDTRSCAPPPR